MLIIATSQHEKRASVIATQMPKMILYTGLAGMWTFCLRQGVLLSCLWTSHQYSNNRYSRTSPIRKPRRHRKLSNGSGIIKHLSRKHSRPWAAYPPVTEFTLEGSPSLGAAIGYFTIYDEAYQALMLYSNASDHIKQSNVFLSFRAIYKSLRKF